MWRDNTLPGSPVTHVVMQQRTGMGKFLAIPGGFLDPGEEARQAALREANEEVSLPLNCTQGTNPLVVMRKESFESGPVRLQYMTFFADVMRDFVPRRPPGDTESIAVEWAPIDQVGKRSGKYFPLLPEFCNVWDTLRQMVRTMGPPPRVIAPAQTKPPVKPPQSGRPNRPSQSIDPAKRFPPIQRPKAIKDPAAVPPKKASTGKRKAFEGQSDEEGSGEESGEESGEPENVKGDKKVVPGEPAKRARTSPVVEESEDKEEISGRYVSSFRVDRTFRGGRIGYSSWNAKGRRDPACRPS